MMVECRPGMCETIGLTLNTKTGVEPSSLTTLVLEGWGSKKQIKLSSPKR